MGNKNDSFEEMLRDEFEREAADIQKKIDESGIEPISDSVKNDIRARLYEQIAAYENEKVYAQLSDEDRRALELGKEMMRQQEEETTKTVVRKKKRPKVYLVLAAALVLAMALGVTSMGGPDRVIKIVKSAVGDREVVKVNSNEDNLVMEQEDEETAYQKIRDTFGVDAVRFYGKPDGMVFDKVELVKELQMSEVFYKYKNKNVVYLISALYVDATYGIDVEDEIIEQYYIEKKDVKIEMTEYRVKGTGETRFSAKFSYDSLEYFLVGTMEKEEFEKIVNSFVFS